MSSNNNTLPPSSSSHKTDLNIQPISRVFCVAPMLEWTDRHCRFFHRLISKHAVLYTEMVTTGALIHNDHARFLQFNSQEHPLALQLGGSDPGALAICTKKAQDSGYDEVNLNVGCPSNRVQKGRFGACLMAEPNLVAECISEMSDAVSIPVTVKSRIGIDEQDSYTALTEFIGTVATAGCKTFIIHARKALLNGLSPKQNREIPPLRYDMARQIKKDFPNLEIILNGGISSLDQAEIELSGFDGVMIGREAYHHPYLLADVDKRFYNANILPKSRYDIVLELIPYIKRELAQNIRLHSITRHILGLFHGIPGAKGWRRYISEHACKPTADEGVVLEALKFIQL